MTSTEASLVQDLPRPCLESIFGYLGSCSSRRAFSLTCVELNFVARETVSELVVPEDGGPDVLLSSRLHRRFPYCTTLTFRGMYRVLTHDHVAAFGLHAGRPLLRRVRCLRILPSRFAPSPLPAGSASHGRPDNRNGLTLPALIHLLRGCASSPLAPAPLSTSYSNTNDDDNGDDDVDDEASCSSVTPHGGVSQHVQSSGGGGAGGSGGGGGGGGDYGSLNRPAEGGGALRELLLDCRLLLSSSGEELQAAWRLVHPGSTLFLRRGVGPQAQLSKFQPAAALALAEAFFSAVAAHAPGLHALHLERGCDVATTGVSLRYLSRLPHLASLRLYGSHLTPPSYDQGVGTVGSGGSSGSSGSSTGAPLGGLRCLPPLSRMHLEEFTLCDDLWRALAAAPLPPFCEVSISSSVGYLALTAGPAPAATATATAPAGAASGSGAFSGGGLVGGSFGSSAVARSSGGAAAAGRAPVGLPMVPLVTRLELRDASLYGPLYARAQVRAVGHLLSLVPCLKELHLYVTAPEVQQQVAPHLAQVPRDLLVLRGVRAAALGRSHQPVAALLAAAALEEQEHAYFGGGAPPAEVGPPPAPLCYTDLLLHPIRALVDIALADVTDADLEALFGGGRLRARLTALRLERCSWTTELGLRHAVAASLGGTAGGTGLTLLDLDGCHRLSEDGVVEAAVAMAVGRRARTAAADAYRGGGMCAAAATAVVRVHNCKLLPPAGWPQLQQRLPAEVVLEAGSVAPKGF